MGPGRRIAQREGLRRQRVQAIDVSAGVVVARRQGAVQARRPSPHAEDERCALATGVQRVRQDLEVVPADAEELGGLADGSSRWAVTDDTGTTPLGACARGSRITRCRPLAVVPPNTSRVVSPLFLSSVKAYPAGRGHRRVDQRPSGVTGGSPGGLAPANMAMESGHAEGPHTAPVRRLSPQDRLVDGGTPLRMVGVARPFPPRVEVAGAGQVPDPLPRRLGRR